jgi:hypothetical protein
MRGPQITERQGPQRRFNLADGLIVTAAAATTLALLRDAPDWSHHVFTGGNFGGYLNPPLALRLAARAIYVLPPWTVAIFLLGLRQPRPPLRRLILQPGMAACGAVVLWLGFKTLLLVTMMVGEPQKWTLVTYYVGDGVALVSWAAPTVAGAWLVLAIAGRWRLARGWIERCGRALGVSWLALEVLNDLRILF